MTAGILCELCEKPIENPSDAISGGQIVANAVDGPKMLIVESAHPSCIEIWRRVVEEETRKAGSGSG